jgi:hypothetical protein
MTIETDLSQFPLGPQTLDEFLQKHDAHVLVEQWLYIQPSTVNSSQPDIELRAFTKAHGDGKWHVIVRDRQQAPGTMDILERETRRHELATPASQAHLQANLYWVSERGEEEDLELLQRLRDAPPPEVPEIVLQLIDIAIQRILERMQQDDSLAAAQRQGVAAYRVYKAEWDRQYAGRYIAVYQGKVIAADANKHCLLEKVVRKQREEQNPFRACIVKTASPHSDS